MITCTLTTLNEVKAGPDRFLYAIYVYEAIGTDEQKRFVIKTH